MLAEAGLVTRNATMAPRLDTLVLLVSTLLLFWKAIGLTCFTAGLVRARNTNDVLAKNLVLLAITIIFFLPITQHIIFSLGINAYFPSFSYHLTSQTDPQNAGSLFELLLAVIPLFIITGATAERLRLWPLLIFSLFFLGIIYPVSAYWVWGQGFLHHMGFIDYGGAAVLHVTGAIAAIAALFFLGPRQGRYNADCKSIPLPGANIPLAMLGAMQIWFGSIGLNVGTALLNAPNGLAMAFISTVCLNTLVAAAAGLLCALLLTRIIYGTIDVTLLFNGALAGVVAISAAPVLTNINIVVLIGAVAGLLTIASLMVCNRLRIDDPIGAIAVHGVGGIWGILAVSLTIYYMPTLASINSLPPVGSQQLCIQLLGLCCIAVWVLLASFVVWSLIRYTIGLRIKPQDEYKGLDIISCGMNAYPEFITPGQEK
jgi:Amt family ammonium transporter